MEMGSAPLVLTFCALRDCALILSHAQSTARTKEDFPKERNLNFSKNIYEAPTLLGSFLRTPDPPMFDSREKALIELGIDQSVNSLNCRLRSFAVLNRQTYCNSYRYGM